MRAGDVLALVQHRRQVAAMAAPLPGLGDVGPQDRLEPLAGRRRLADRGELAQVLATRRSCQAARIDSISGKYLYRVARPMPLCRAIWDIVRPVSPC